jgi:hypothetical protein
LLSVLATRARSRTSPKVRESFSPTLSPLSLSFTPSNSADVISTVEFDSTGNYLATGDKGGRVVLFERNDQVPSSVVFSIVPSNPLCRRKAASTSFTPNSNLTNQNSTTSSRWKSRRRSIRSNGANDRTRHTFYCPQTVRLLLIWSYNY